MPRAHIRYRKETINNSSIMYSFVSHIDSVTRHGNDWMCSLRNGWRLRITNSLMTEVAQTGK